MVISQSHLSSQEVFTQGAPCSSLIFLLCAEIFAKNLRNSNKILGISVQEFKFLLGQYADDTDLSNVYQQESMDEIMRIIELFSLNAGFTLNYDKTVAYRIGSLKKTNAQLITQETVSWTSESINVLGVWINEDEDLVIQQNYKPLLEKIEGILKTWNKRHLSLMGKILVVNTLVVSLFVYKMSSVAGPEDDVVCKVEKMIENFLWNGHRPKIKLETLKANRSAGGAQLVDLKAKNMSLKCLWRGILASDPKLSTLVYQNICPDLGEDIWKCCMDEKVIMESFCGLSKFWKEVLCAVNQLKISQGDSEADFIWHNKDIKVDGKSVFWKKAYQKELKYVYQLYRHGSLKSYVVLEEEFGLDVMSVNCLISAIPSWMKTKAKRNEVQCVSVEPHAWTAKTAYKVLNVNSVNLPEKAMRWSKELFEEVTASDLLNALVQTKRTSNVPKIRSFIFRLIHRALVFNIQLKHWGIRETDECTFCCGPRENASHLFLIVR